MEQDLKRMCTCHTHSVFTQEACRRYFWISRIPSKESAWEGCTVRVISFQTKPPDHYAYETTATTGNGQACYSASRQGIQQKVEGQQYNAIAFWKTTPNPPGYFKATSQPKQMIRAGGGGSTQKLKWRRIFQITCKNDYASAIWRFGRTGGRAGGREGREWGEGGEKKNESKRERPRQGEGAGLGRGGQRWKRGRDKEEEKKEENDSTREKERDAVNIRVQIIKVKTYFQNKKIILCLTSPKNKRRNSFYEKSICSYDSHSHTKSEKQKNILSLIYT